MFLVPLPRYLCSLHNVCMHVFHYFRFIIIISSIFDLVVFSLDVSVYPTNVFLY
jgi:hypothetical protein